MTNVDYEISLKMLTEQKEQTKNYWNHRNSTHVIPLSQYRDGDTAFQSSKSFTFYLQHRLLKEDSRDFIKVRYQPKYRNLNILLKEFMEFANVHGKEDYCIIDSLNNCILLSGELLVKDGIYKIQRSISGAQEFDIWRKNMLKSQEDKILAVKDAAEKNKMSEEYL